MNFVLHKQKIHGWDMSKRIIVVYSDRTYVGTGAGPGPILCQTLHIATSDPPPMLQRPPDVSRAGDEGGFSSEQV